MCRPKKRWPTTLLRVCYGWDKWKSLHLLARPGLKLVIQVLILTPFMYHDLLVIFFFAAKGFYKKLRRGSGSWCSRFTIRTIGYCHMAYINRCRLISFFWHLISCLSFMGSEWLIPARHRPMGLTHIYLSDNSVRCTLSFAWTFVMILSAVCCMYGRHMQLNIKLRSSEGSTK